MKRTRVFLWLVLTTTTLSLSLLMLATPALSAKAEVDIPPFQDQPGPFFQATVTPTLTVSEGLTQTVEQATDSVSPTLITTTNVFSDTPSGNFNLTFETLGYSETTLSSPSGREEYSFTLPENKDLQEESFVEFDLSFVYLTTDETADLPQYFGTIYVSVDGLAQEKFDISEQELDHFKIRAALPASTSDQEAAQQTERHRVEIFFDSGSCSVASTSSLVIHNSTSFFSLNLREQSIIPDLSRYPAPFYQRSIEPDAVTFGIPETPSPAEATGIVAMTAKLGDLTSNRLVISSTLDIDLVEDLSDPASIFDQHLIVVGQPQNNKLIPFLAEITELPVTLHQRQLNLVSQGPETVSLGDLIDYKFTVTNTSEEETNVSLVSDASIFTEFVECSPQCDGQDGTKIAWESNSLAPNETRDFSLTLKATQVISNFQLENTVTLIEDEAGPINADTLVTFLSGASESNTPTDTLSAQEQSEYFFAVDNLAVPEGDGVIQELVSPWNNNRAILIVSGLSDEAVRKASQAMSSEINFPGMQQDYALVQNAFPPTEEVQPNLSKVELTFEDLGETDQILQGRLTQRRNYFFFIPVGWRLTDDAFVDLQFSHAQPTETQNAGLSLLFNNQPIGSIILSDKTALNGKLRVSLPNAAVRNGQLNRLTVEVSPYQEVDPCAADIRDFWFVVKNTSKVSLDHDQRSDTRVSLSNFPSPFSNQSSLADLLFVLPETPTADEWYNALRLAATLGNNAGGNAILPVVMLGADKLTDEELSNFQMIAMGRPLRNELVQQINSNLPQPFLPNSDMIQQQIDDVTLRLPREITLGYIQLLTSPWNEERMILAVTGTNDEGMKSAARVLYTGQGRISGNLALIQNSNIESVDTRKAESLPEVVATVDPDSPLVPTATATDEVSTVALAAESTPVPLPQAISDAPVEPDQPIWLIPFVSTMVLVVLGIFAFVFVQSRRQRKTIN